MADPVLTLDSANVSVEPGGQARVTVTISNPGSIVEGYRVEVLGEGPKQWAEVVPAEVSVYPQQEATAVVVFSPPSGSSAPGGTHAFGVRATSTVEPDSSAVVEGDLDIRKVFGLQAKIVPVTSSGRWRGRHVVQLSNWGNAPVRLRMAASDPDAALGFYLHPDVVELPIGVGASVRVSVKTRKPFLRGTPVRLPFQIVGEQVDPTSAPRGPVPVLPYGDPARPVVDGAFSQRPILSRSVVTAAALLAAALVAVGAWAYTLRPTSSSGTLASGAPAQPAKPDAKAVAPGEIAVTWTPKSDATAYQVQLWDKKAGSVVGTGPKVAAPQAASNVDGLRADTEYCFKLVAFAGDLHSPASKQVCARTSQTVATESPTATPTPTPTLTPTSTPTPSATASSSSSATSGSPTKTATPTASGTASVSPTLFAGGKYAIVVQAVPMALGGDEGVNQTVANLKAAGVAGYAIHTDDPAWAPLVADGRFTNSWLVLAGPYDTVAAASAECVQKIKPVVPSTNCSVTVQPNR